MTPPDLPPRPVPRAPLTDVVPKRTLVIIAAVVLLAVLGTVLALTLGGGDDKASGAKGGGTVAGASPSAGTKEDGSGGTHTGGSQSASASGSSSNDTAVAGGAGAGVTPGGAGEAATTPYKGAQGYYSIDLPAGWKFKTSSGDGDRFTGPDGQKLLVAWTTTPKGDPLTDWKNQERYMVRSQYKKIRIAQVPYRGWKTADWEFTYTEGGTAYRTVDRGFVVNDGLAYALMYTAKSAAWDTALRETTWKALTDTFKPKK